MVTSIFFFTWWLATKLKLADTLKAVMATAVSICGVSAAIAAAGAVLAKKEEITYITALVIVTALLAENPKWNRELAAAPALKGKEFPTNFPGFFDLIGLVQTRVNGEGDIVYPPAVHFKSEDDSFLAKFNKTTGSCNP